MSDDGRCSYFAYGSNMDPVQMADRCPGAEPIQVAVLHDHRLAYTYDAPGWEGGVATVIPATGEQVWGVVWALTSKHLDTLDEYEGVDIGIYRRELTDVFVNGDRPMDAFIYITNDTLTRLPNRRYIDALVRGAEHFELPAWYIELLRETPTL